MKRTIAVLLAVAVLALFSTVPCAAEKTWNANSVWPPNNHHTIGMQEFAAKVKAATNGELEIVVNAGGALGYKGPELLKAVRDGLVPLSDMLISGVAGDEKTFQIVTLPFLVEDFQQARLLLDTARPYFDKLAAKWGQKILYIAPWPGAGLWAKRKIVSVEQMAGLKTRTYDKNGALVVEAVGGTPYALPFSEVYSSLATGLIDSVITSTPTGVDGKFWEVLNYYHPLNITIATDMVNVNLRAFQKLDKQTQDTLVRLGKEMEDIMWEKVARLDKEKEAICNENGIETVPPSKALLEDLKRVTEGIRADWLEDAPPMAQKIYAEFLQKVQ